MEPDYLVFIDVQCKYYSILYTQNTQVCHRYISLTVEEDDETSEEDAFVKEAKNLHELESEDETELRIFYFYFSISIPGPSSLSSLC
jgi:hypothetical protein